MSLYSLVFNYDLSHFMFLSNAFVNTKQVCVWINFLLNIPFVLLENIFSGKIFSTFFSICFVVKSLQNLKKKSFMKKKKCKTCKMLDQKILGKSFSDIHKPLFQLGLAWPPSLNPHSFFLTHKNQQCSVRCKQRSSALRGGNLWQGFANSWLRLSSWWLCAQIVLFCG